MFCQNCGKEIEGAISFCIHCGKSTKSGLVRRQSRFKILKKVLIVFVLFVVAALVAVFYYFEDFDSLYEDSEGYDILSELEPSLEPLGYFTNSDVFDDEDMGWKEWYSYVEYYELESPEIDFDENRYQFKNQTNIISSVVKLVCEDDDYFYIGSGTNTDPSGYILTNLHIVEGVDGCAVGFVNSGTGLVEEAYWAVPIIDRDENMVHDLAYLSIKSPMFDDNYNIYGYADKVIEGLFPYYSNPSGECEDAIQLGDSLFVVGFPNITGGALTITNGLVSSLYSVNGYIITSAKISSGNSGGLAIDARGCYVGVPTAVYIEKEEEQYGEIIDAQFVYEFEDSITDELNDYINSY
ncbi:MAG: trypsin-like peptidase domain-containing protein [Candidatus Komeilibacteria bacterium]